MSLYQDVVTFEYDCNCTDVSFLKWQDLMEGAVKANGSEIKRLIKKYHPELYDFMGLEFYNPYESRSVRTKTHLIYNHSGIEYFFRYKTNDD